MGLSVRSTGFHVVGDTSAIRDETGNEFVVTMAGNPKLGKSNGF